MKSPLLALFAGAAVLTISACGGGASAVTRATGARSIAEEVSVGVRNTAHTTAADAAHTESAAARAAAVEATGATVTSDATAVVAYRELVGQELRNATVSTLCTWLGTYLTTGALPSQDDFEGAMIEALASTAQSLGVPPQREWILDYVSAADSFAQQVAAAPDLEGTVQETLIALACS